MDRLTRLALSARGGDGRALDQFVHNCYDDVWRLCSALVDQPSADDLTQEAFVRIVNALPQFRADSPARTWLLAIARYTCLDELRARSRRRQRDATLAAGHTGGKTTRADASEESVTADLLRRLDLDRRSAFVLTQILGLSYERAAEICQCPAGTIRSRVYRARADLINQLNSTADPEDTNQRPTQKRSTHTA